jgi:hypothetical protein
MKIDSLIQLLLMLTTTHSTRTIIHKTAGDLVLRDEPMEQYEFKPMYSTLICAIRNNIDIIYAYDLLLYEGCIDFDQYIEYVGVIGKRHRPCDYDLELDGKLITYQIPHISSAKTKAREYRLGEVERLIWVERPDNDRFYVTYDHYDHLIPISFHHIFNRPVEGDPKEYYGCYRMA